MRHGTHEKQLSNIFAWLLDASGSHGLGDAFQTILVRQIAQSHPHLPALPASGYRVQQEVDTTGRADLQGRDIADIVLTSQAATIVVENYESSDGHGHDYQGYLDYARPGETTGVVVMLPGTRRITSPTGGNRLPC